MPTTTPALIADSATSGFHPGTIERRDLGPRDILIDIKFAGICHSDIHTARGEWGDVSYPIVVGHEIAGTVAEVGAEVSAGDPCGELESTKSVSDVYAPVSGTVTARNDALDGSPELVNAEPYGDGWMFEIQPSDPTELSDLLDSTTYRTQVDAAG